MNQIKPQTISTFKIVNLFCLLFGSYYTIDYYKNSYKEPTYEIYNENIKYDNLMNFSYGDKIATFNYTITNYTFVDDSNIYFYEGLNGTSHIYMNEHDIGFSFDTPGKISTDFRDVILPNPTSFLIKNDNSVLFSLTGINFNSVMDHNPFFFDKFLIPISTYWTNNEGDNFHITGLFELPMDEILSKGQTKSFYDRFRDILIEM